MPSRLTNRVRALERDTPRPDRITAVFTGIGEGDDRIYWPESPDWHESVQFGDVDPRWENSDGSPKRVVISE